MPTQPDETMKTACQLGMPSKYFRMTARWAHYITNMCCASNIQMEFPQVYEVPSVVVKVAYWLLVCMVHAGSSTTQLERPFWYSKF